MDRQITRTIRIAARAERVWVATADLARCPGSCSTITSVHQTNGNGLQLGARFRIRQPLQKLAIWEVTELTAGKSFSWRSARRFLCWVASYELNEAAQQDTSFTLRPGISGSIRGTLWPVLRPVLSLAIKKECADLKARCERSNWPTWK